MSKQTLAEADVVRIIHRHSALRGEKAHRIAKDVIALLAESRPSVPAEELRQITHPDEGPCPVCSAIFDTHIEGCPYEAIDALLAQGEEAGLSVDTLLSEFGLYYRDAKTSGEMEALIGEYTAKLTRAARPAESEPRPTIHSDDCPVRHGSEVCNCGVRPAEDGLRDMLLTAREFFLKCAEAGTFLPAVAAKNVEAIDAALLTKP